MYTVNGTAVVATPSQLAADNVTITTPVTVLPSGTVQVVAGFGTTAHNTTGAETASISVNTSTDPTPVASNPGFTIVAGPATQDVVTAGGGQSATVGTAFATLLSSTVEDQFGNPVLAPGTAVSFTAPASGPSGTFVNGTNTTSTTTNGSGIATATTFTSNSAAGSNQVTTTSPGLTSNIFTETNLAGAASQVVPTAGNNQSAAIGTAFATTLAATVEDSHGNPVLVANTTVTFTAPATGVSGTFVNGTNTTFANTNTSGIVIATTFTANTAAGPFSVTGSSVGLTTNSFSETNLAGVASQVVPTAGSGQSTPVGTAFATTLSATVEDSHGNPVLTPGTNVTFTAPGSGASGTFFNGTDTTSTTTNGSGVASATTFTAGSVPGAFTIAGSSFGLTTNNFSETDLTGPASQVVVTAGNSQSTAVGTSFATTLSATIEDSHGNPVLTAGTFVTFTAPGSGASGTFLGTGITSTTTTNGSGVATATVFTANTTAGLYAVIGASAGTTSASFNETNLAGAATQVVLTAGGGQSAVAGSAFATNLSATIEDAHGNPVLTGGTTVTFTGPASGASGTFASDSSFTSGVPTSGGGVATASVFTANTTGGVYAMAVTSVGLTAASSNETNEVVPGAPTSLIATLGNTSVVLSWNGPSSNGGSTITGYNIYEGTSSGGESASPVSGVDLAGCTSGSGPSGCQVTGLTNGITYYFNVRAVNVAGPSVASNGASATPAASWSGGYDLAAADGGVFALGTIGFHGSQGGKPLTKPIVGTAATPDGGGYWLVASDGGVFAFGDAHFYGSEGGKPLTKPIVGMASTPNGGGYWLVASDGGVFAFGNAHFYGSEGGKPLTKPIVGMAADATTGGYWEVASDGGIFSFNAPFAGSMGATHLNKPIVGMAADPVTGGYWEVASDGGIFAFDAGYFGSEGAKPLNKPIVGMAADPVTGGYWEVASDGGIFSFNAPFEGSLGGTRLSQPIVGIGTN
jgi:hypothetical protein